MDKLVALGSFNCSLLYHYNDALEKLNEELRGEITITEIYGSDDSNRKLIHRNEMQMFSKNDITPVTLAKPIVIRPKFKYEIQIKIKLPSKDKLYTQSKYKERIEQSITMKFYDYPIIDDAARGLISLLEFNII